MNKRLVGVAIAAILALVGTIVILRYVNDADERAQADVELVEVFVIKDKVNAGADEAEIRSAIGSAEIAASTVIDGVLTDLQQLDGKVAAVDLVPGEQVLLSRLVDVADYARGRSKLVSVPDGFQEITLSLEPQRVLGGQVVPGDTVGVVVTFEEATIGGVNSTSLAAAEALSPEEFAAFIQNLKEIGQDIKLVDETHFLLHKMLVTRVQIEELPREQVDAEGNTIDTALLSPTGNLLVTLAVETKDIERVVFSAERGTIWMTYDPESAAGHEDTEGVDRGNVFDLPHEPEATEPAS